MRKKVFSLILALVMLCSMTLAIPVQAATSGHTEHSIGTGSSWAGNPLKGFLPFDGTTTTFPHSMEWFYIPVRDVQTGINSFNWTALDNHLNAISARGHQAVFRFYLDYPAMPTGVPQFLIDGGLAMNSYSEYGGGQCPDYSNQNLRTAMKNFLAALGARYDGNSKIAFITVGLLGYWGEWHCYPYDSDTSDGKPNWEPSDTVKNEVLTAFDNAFNKTPLLLRYPAANAPSMNFGYHDDSFVWETLNTNSWNFVPRLTAAGVQNKWQQQPIGGELRPEIQDTIFETTPWTGGNGEKWTDCVNATHVSWLMNEAIKRYSSGSTEYNNAVTASKQMGYDFQVSKAYYDNLSGSSSNLYLGIDIKNIGTAPFYYDSTVWPVKVGVKQNGNLVTSWTTAWNLNTIAADGQIDTFEFTTPSGCGLSNGTYNMCIMVQNPLSNGNKLGFANAGQNADGWLDLGTFTVSTSADTQAPTAPTNLTSTGKTSSSVSLSWTASTDNVGVTGYEIYRGGTSVGTTTSTSYTDTGLAANTSYTYTVKAKDAAGNYSAASNSVTVTTSAASSTTSYEAESSANTLAGGATSSSVSGASGGMVVGYVGNNSGTLQFNNVNAASSGSYTMTIYYLSGEARNATVSVNGGSGTSVAFSSLGNWTTIGSTAVTVNLNAGNNTIKFSNASGWAPDFDRITINSTSGGGGGTTITVDGNASDWSSISTIATATYSSTQHPTSLKATYDSTYLYFCAQGTSLGANNEIFLNTDNNTATGYTSDGGVWGGASIGADYMIENGVLYQHSGNSTSWSWTNLGSANVTVSSNSSVYELRVARSALGTLSSSQKCGFKTMDGSWVSLGALPVGNTLASYTIQ